MTPKEFYNAFSPLKEETWKVLEPLFHRTTLPKQHHFVPESGTVKEKDGYLYIGGDVAPFIGKYKLPEAEGSGKSNAAVKMKRSWPKNYRE